MIIEVKQEDIDEGEQMSPCYCFLALAIRRTTGKKMVSVDYTNIVINGIRYDTTPELEQDLVKYDNFGTIKPRSYEITERKPCQVMN